MGFLKTILEGMANGLNEASKIMADPNSAGKEHARHDYGGASPSHLIEGIQRDNQLIDKCRAQAQKDPSNWGASIDQQFRESHKRELMRMLDDELK